MDCNGQLHNIYGYPNQHTMSLKNSSQEEDKGGNGVVEEVCWKIREESINRKRRVCAVIWAPSPVIKGGWS